MQRLSRLIAGAAILTFVGTGCVANAPVDDADAQGVLTSTSGETQLDPAIAGGGLDVLSVFEPLLRFDAKTLRPIPGAAQLPVISGDGLTYRLAIRADSKFSDGTPVRARDFVFGFSRVCDPAIKGPYASVGYDVVGCAEWSQLDPKKAPPEALRAAKDKLTTNGIRATAENELTITLTHPASYFTSILALWIFAPVREADVEHGGAQWAEPGTYIGNGPFVLSAWRHNDRLVFTPNRYYRSPSKLKQWVKLIIAESAVQLAAYRHDEIDVLDLVAAGSTSAEVQNDPALQKETVRATTACTNWVGFNGRRAPFDDPSVRLAFAKAIDRDSYVRDVLGGLGVPALSLIARGLPGYDAADDVQRFDPAEARRLLAASRYAGTEALRSVVIPHAPAPSLQRSRAEWLRDQWKTNLGIDVASEQVEGPALSARFARLETRPHVFFSGWCADYPDQQNWLTLLFHSKSAFNTTTGWTGFSDAGFDRLVTDGDRETDRSKRDDLYLKASRILSGSTPVAFLGTNTRLVLLKPWVRGVVDGPLDYEIGLFAGQESIYVVKKGR